MSQPPEKAILSYVALALWLAPIVAFVALFSSVATNVPYLDDYDVILAFLNDAAAADSLAEGVRLAFAQHVEHRMAFLRLVAALDQWIEGSVDFRTLDALGCLGLVALAAGLFAALRSDSQRVSARIVLFTPVVLLLFQPQFWDCLLWPTSSLANFWVVVFALASFHGLMHGARRAFTGAIALALLASFTQANGLLVWPLGAAGLFALHRRRDLALWLAATFAVLLAYFAGWVAPEGPGIAAALRKPFEVAGYVLNLLGSAPAFSIPVLSLTLGLAGSVAATVLVATGLARRNPTLLLLLLFVLGSVAANALGRVPLGGPGYALQSPRYQFFSAVFWALTYLGAIECLPRRRELLAWTATLLAAAFCIASYATYAGEVERVSQRMQRGMLAWSSRGTGLVYPDEARASAILRRSIELGVYEIPLDDLLLSTPIESAPADRP